MRMFFTSIFTICIVLCMNLCVLQKEDFSETKTENTSVVYITEKQESEQGNLTAEYSENFSSEVTGFILKTIVALIVVAIMIMTVINNGKRS